MSCCSNSISHSRHLKWRHSSALCPCVVVKAGTGSYHAQTGPGHWSKMALLTPVGVINPVKQHRHSPVQCNFWSQAIQFRQHLSQGLFNCVWTLLGIFSQQSDLLSCLDMQSLLTPNFGLQINSSLLYRQRHTSAFNFPRFFHSPCPGGMWPYHSVCPPFNKGT